MANIYSYQRVEYLHAMGGFSESFVQRLKNKGINYIQDIADTLSIVDESRFKKTFNIRTKEYKNLIRFIQSRKITPNPDSLKTNCSIQICKEESDDVYTKAIREVIRTQSINNINLSDIASVRLTNALRCENITTVRELLLYVEEYGIKSFKHHRNFGKKSQEELIGIIDQYISKIENNASSNVSEDSYPNTYTQESPTIISNSGDYSRVPNISIYNLNISNYTKSFLSSHNIYWTKDLISFCCTNTMDELSKYKLGTISTQEIVELVAILVDQQKIWELANKIKGTIGLKELLGIFAYYLDSKLTDISGYNINIIDDILQRYYKSRLTKVSKRTFNIISRIDLTYKDLCILDILPKHHVYNISYPKQCGKNSWGEILELSNDINSKFNDIIGMTPSELMATLVSTRFPSISHPDMAMNVYNHYTLYGYWPMFFILAQHISLSKSRFNSIYKHACGILCSQLSMKYIAAIHHLSTSRVRQIYNKKEGADIDEYVDLNEYSQYGLTSRLYISKYDGLYSQVIERENLHALSFYAFGSLIDLITPVQHYVVGGNDYFFTNKITDHFNIKRALNDIQDTLSQKVTHNIRIPVSVFVYNYWKNGKSKELTNDVIKVLSEIILYNYNVQIDDDCIITLPQTKIDISKELYNILDEYGEPMSLEGIFMKFKERYPNHKYNKAIQIQRYLTSNIRISHIGKTSCYALNKWKVYTGTIRDLIYDTLDSIDRPLTADELLPYISTVYNTSVRSIRSTIITDKSDKFIFFKNGYIGLKKKVYPSNYDDIRLNNRRHRQSFEESIVQYEQYLTTHHHMPLYTGSENEKFLYRWYNNVMNKCVAITPEREAAFNAMVDRCAKYMVNSIEYYFYMECNEYQDFLEEHMELPSCETNSKLYNWFIKNSKLYNTYEDRRKGYFEKLVEYIESHNFVIKN